MLAWYPKVDSNHFQGTGEALHAAGTQATAVGNTGEEGTRVVLTTSVPAQPAGNSVAVDLRP